jgi:hypothetical protein
VIRCPSCDSNDTAIAGVVSFESDQIADQRECGACGERWMMPARSLDECGDVERIELGADDAFGVDDAGAGTRIEEWFEPDSGDIPPTSRDN